MSILQRPPQRGFTLVELMTVITVAGVLLALVIPSFTGMLARKRLEGVAQELGTDLQFARSEAVRRNMPVRIIFGTNCYTVYQAGTTADTDCATLGTNAVVLKGPVQVNSGPALAFVPAIAGTLYVEFEPVRGMAQDPPGANDRSGRIDISSSAGNWQLRSLVNRFGRMKSCSPNASVPGYSSDCSI